MEEAECLVAPTKIHESQTIENHIGSPLDILQGGTNSMQSAKHSGMCVEGHPRSGGTMSGTQERDVKKTSRHGKAFRKAIKKLRSRIKELYRMNDVLRSRVDELTAAWCDMNAEKTHGDEAYKDIFTRIIGKYASGQGLKPDDLTSENVREIWDNIYFDGEAYKHLRAQVEDFETQTDALKKDLMASRSQCQTLQQRQYDQEAKLQDSLQNLVLCQDEARGLRTQMQVLQKEMLAQVSSNEIIPDDMFSRDFRGLASLVKSLSRSVHPARENIDICDVLKPFTLLHGVSEYHWDTRARKKAYVEAWIWSVLIDAVFQYSFGFCGELIDLHEDWCFIFGKGWLDNWPKPSPESETWRFTTVNKMVGDIGRETLVASQNHGYHRGPNAHAHHLQRQVLQRKLSITEMIESHLTMVAPLSDLSYLSDIVNKVFELALNMSMQRSRIQVTWPDIGERFEKNYMTPVPDLSGEDIHEGVVAYIVNPGLTRWGNTHGQNFDICYEIVPSLVQLEPVQTRRTASRILIEAKQGSERI